MTAGLKRPVRRLVSWTAEEYSDVEQAATAAGLSAEAYVRSTTLERARGGRPAITRPSAPAPAGAQGRLFFPPTVVAEVASSIRRGALPLRDPPDDDEGAVLDWLIDASEDAHRVESAERKREDQRQVWRCGGAYDRVTMIVEPASSQGELAVCVAVQVARQAAAARA